MNLQLQNKTALITGSTASIGFATAKQLAAEGANLITYVANPLSSATNGAALRADGGVVKTIV